MGNFISPDPINARITIRSLELSSLTSHDLLNWYELLDRSCEPNPFLSPDFVLPLIRHLKAPSAVMMLVVESVERGCWLAAGVFEIKAMSRWLPLSYARGISSPYTFLDGILVDRQEGAEAMVALFLSQRRRRDWHGLQFAAIRRTSDLSRHLDRAASVAGIRLDYSRDWHRASFINRGPVTSDDVLERCSKSRRKSLRRCRRRLEALGEVSFRLVPATCGTSPSVDTFLHLEQLGWKGAAGTAIASHPDHEAFFRQMVDGFSRRDAVLFGELLLNGVPIASTCNLRCGDLLCAFKIGWDPAYADSAIGIWSEVELAVAVSQQATQIARIDSSAKLGSYVESVWRDREPMVSVAYTWSNRGAASQLAHKYLQLLKSAVVACSAGD